MNSKIIDVRPAIDPDITAFDDCLITAIEWKEQAEWDKKNFHSESEDGQSLADERIAAAEQARTRAENARLARISEIRDHDAEPESRYRSAH